MGVWLRGGKERPMSRLRGTLTTYSEGMQRPSPTHACIARKQYVAADCAAVYRHDQDQDQDHSTFPGSL